MRWQRWGGGRVMRAVDRPLSGGVGYACGCRAAALRVATGCAPRGGVRGGCARRDAHMGAHTSARTCRETHVGAATSGHARLSLPGGTHASGRICRNPPVGSAVSGHTHRDEHVGARVGMHPSGTATLGYAHRDATVGRVCRDAHLAMHPSNRARRAASAGAHGGMRMSVRARRHGTRTQQIHRGNVRQARYQPPTAPRDRSTATAARYSVSAQTRSAARRSTARASRRSAS